MISMVSIIQEGVKLRKSAPIVGAGVAGTAGAAGIGVAGLHQIGKDRNQFDQKAWDILHPTKYSKWVGNKLYPSLNPRGDGEGFIDNVKRGVREVKKHYQ